MSQFNFQMKLISSGRVFLIWKQKWERMWDLNPRTLDLQNNFH